MVEIIVYVVFALILGGCLLVLARIISEDWD